MDTLALTDRDGTYGAVKFAKACLGAGIRPVLGVDLAYRPTSRWSSRAQRRVETTKPSRTPVRGGAFRDPRLPRATFLARGRAGLGGDLPAGLGDPPGRRAGEPGGRPRPARASTSPGGDVLVLLGPGSELGRGGHPAPRRPGPGRARPLAGAARRPRTSSSSWSPTGCPGSGGDWGPGTSQHAARMAGLARRAGLGAVLTNAVRYADRLDAPTVDVLDAARRLVALDRRHVDRGNAEGFLKSGKQMHEVAEEICRLAGLSADTGREARQLLARTRTVADRCALDPRSDLGLGEVHFPEFELSGTLTRPRLSGGSADGLLRARCEGAIGDRYGSAPRQRIWKRLDDELEVIRGLGYASYFLTVGDVTDLIREMGVRCAARGSGAGSLVNYLLGVSGVDPIRHGLLMERFLSPLRQALPDIDVDVESARRLEVYQAILDKYGGERCVCVSMMDTYRVRHAVRDVGAALGMPPGETDAIAKAFPHIRARDARVALRELPELRASRAGRGAARPDVPAGRAARRPAPPHRRPPLRGAALRRHPARPDPGRGQLRRVPDEPVRQGRRRGPRPAQARRARHPHAVLDGPRADRDPAGRRRGDRPRRRGRGALRRPRDLRHDLVGQDPRRLPDRVARPARAGRQVRHRDLRGDHHRHLAVPARTGQERHDHALPRRQAGLEGADLPPRRPASDPRARPTASWSSTSR